MFEIVSHIKETMFPVDAQSVRKLRTSAAPVWHHKHKWFWQPSHFQSMLEGEAVCSEGVSSVSKSGELSNESESQVDKREETFSFFLAGKWMRVGTAHILLGSSLIC